MPQSFGFLCPPLSNYCQQQQGTSSRLQFQTKTYCSISCMTLLGLDGNGWFFLEKCLVFLVSKIWLTRCKIMESNHVRENIQASETHLSSHLLQNAKCVWKCVWFVHNYSSLGKSEYSCGWCSGWFGWYLHVAWLVFTGPRLECEIRTTRCTNCALRALTAFVQFKCTKVENPVLQTILLCTSATQPMILCT